MEPEQLINHNYVIENYAILCYGALMQQNAHRPRGRPLATGEEMVQISIRIGRSAHDGIKAEATERGISINEVIRERLSKRSRKLNR